MGQDLWIKDGQKNLEKKYTIVKDVNCFSKSNKCNFHTVQD
jgi:hypothetical protein